MECTAPDIGVGDEVAHFYFGQLLAGMVSLSLRYTYSLPMVNRNIFTARVSVIAT